MLKSLWGGGSQEQSTDGGSKVEDDKKNESGEGGSEGGASGGTSSTSYWTKGLGGLMSSVGMYANTLKETVSTTVQTTVESTSILNEFDKEQKKFERERQRQKDSTVPPWVGFNEEEQMKAQILELSADSRNVLRAPPPGIQFHFDFTKSYPVAMSLLKEDPRLQKLRFELVPKKVKEEQFWLNYFYRVFLIKQSSQLASLASESKSDSSVGLVEGLGKETYSSSSPSLDHSFTDIGNQDHNPQDMSEDFASDALITGEEGEEQAISRESVRAELDQLGIGAVKNSATDQDTEKQEGEEWAQLSKELEDLGLDEEDTGEGIGEEEWEQELNQMLGSQNNSDNS